MVEMKRHNKTSDHLAALNQKVLPVLCQRLGKKGLMPLEIKRLSKDILNIIDHGGFYSADILNRKLEQLGWEKNILDNYTFELMLYYLECEGTYTVEVYIEKNNVTKGDR